MKCSCKQIKILAHIKMDKEYEEIFQKEGLQNTELRLLYFLPHVWELSSTKQYCDTSWVSCNLNQFYSVRSHRFRLNPTEHSPCLGWRLPYYVTGNHIMTNYLTGHW